MKTTKKKYEIILLKIKNNAHFVLYQDNYKISEEKVNLTLKISLKRLAKSM